MQRINALFTSLLNVGVGVGVTVAAFFLMWGAFMYMSAAGRPRHNPRAVKRKMSNFPLKRPPLAPTTSGPPELAARSIRILCPESYWYWGDPPGERVLRFAAIVHTTRALGCGRVLAQLPISVARRTASRARALRTVPWMDRACVADAPRDRWPTPAQRGKTRVGGSDLGRPRLRTGLTASMALARTPRGVTVGEVTATVPAIGGQACRDDGGRQAADDRKQLRAKPRVEQSGHARRDPVLDPGLRTSTALVVLREHVRKPLLAAAAHPTASGPVRRTLGRTPTPWSPLDEHDQTLRLAMRALLDGLHLAAASTSRCRSRFGKRLLISA